MNEPAPNRTLPRSGNLRQDEDLPSPLLSISPYGQIPSAGTGEIAPDAQTESGRLITVLGRESQFKDSLCHILRYSRAVILYLEPHL
jgi:hypothetical protein